MANDRVGEPVPGVGTSRGIHAGNQYLRARENTVCLKRANLPVRPTKSLALKFDDKGTLQPFVDGHEGAGLPVRVDHQHKQLSPGINRRA
jgi:hypothetical protein